MLKTLLLIVWNVGLLSSVVLLACVGYLSIKLRIVSPNAPNMWAAPWWRLKVFLNPALLNDAGKYYRKRALICFIIYLFTAGFAAISAVLLRTYY
jgi:hypothetical protein